MSRIDFDTPDAQWVTGDRLDVDTQEAFDSVIAQLRATGYLTDALIMDGDPAAESGRAPYRYIFADSERAKCNSCGTVFTVGGCEVHGAKCPGCHKVVFRIAAPGSIVSFTFDTPRPNMEWVTLRLKHWDDEDYMYFDVYPPKELDESVRESMFTYLADNIDKWEDVIEDNKIVCKIHFSGLRDEDRVIRDMDAFDPEVGYTLIDVWDGVEYPAGSFESPIPTTFTVYKKW